MALAAAVAANPTYLPVLLSPATADGKRTVVTPVAPLASAAAGLGHINLEVDGDGIVRSVARFEGDARWPQLMVPVFRALRPSAATVPARALDPESAAGSDGRFLIPFSRLSESYPQVSFERLLAGEVPEQALRGKVVLIGVTASGLYDRFATPVSGELGPMPGVLIHANVLDTLLTGRAIGQASVGWLATVSLPPLVVLLGGFLLLSAVAFAGADGCSVRGGVRYERCLAVRPAGLGDAGASDRGPCRGLSDLELAAARDDHVVPAPRIATRGRRTLPAAGDAAPRAASFAATCSSGTWR